jgi:uridine kinase
MRTIGIAGGTGSGKSTAAVALCEQHHDTFVLLHLDDYYKKREDAPVAHGYTNWDHPDALKFDEIVYDIEKLKRGEQITVETKSLFYNQKYDNAIGNKKTQTLSPKPIMLLEGHLAFHNEHMRGLLELKIFLDIPVEESIRRRSLKDKDEMTEEYFKNVLLPMHERFVVPTKKYADIVINILDKSSNEVLNILEGEIFR